jgi:hypothetical protein
MHRNCEAIRLFMPGTGLDTLVTIGAAVQNSAREDLIRPTGRPPKTREVIRDVRAVGHREVKTRGDGRRTGAIDG